MEYGKLGRKYSFFSLLQDICEAIIGELNGQQLPGWEDANRPPLLVKLADTGKKKSGKHGGGGGGGHMGHMYGGGAQGYGQVDPSMYAPVGLAPLTV